MRKPLLLILGLVFYASFMSAQADLYFKVKTLLQQNHPELITENKLIAVTTWQVDDTESRDVNKSFEKTYEVYRVARLKGGLKGMVVVAVNVDNLSSTATIALNKDGVVRTISIKAEELKEASAFKNIVFDSNGNEIYRNLAAVNVYPSIQHLITR